MVYKCTECGESMWEQECELMFKNGGSFLGCPKCKNSVEKEIGLAEKKIINNLDFEDSTSLKEVQNKTDVKEQEVKNALIHLVDMRYVTTTPTWDYRLNTKSQEYKSKL